MYKIIMCDNLLESKVSIWITTFFLRKDYHVIGRRFSYLDFLFFKKKNIFEFSLYARVRDNTPNHLLNKCKSLTT